MTPTTRRDGDAPRWTAPTGAAAVVGAAVWILTPWAQAAVYGDRPYVATAFDAASLLAWLLMAAGLVGVRAAFEERYGRLGRASVGAAAVGMAVLGGLSLRSVVVFVDAGFRAVPATGEDPAGLVLTWATLLGFGLAFAGAGGLGLSLRRVGAVPPVAAGLLLAAPAVPLVAVALRVTAGVPVRVGRLLVTTNVALVPFGLGWAALGATLAAGTRASDRGDG